MKNKLLALSVSLFFCSEIFSQQTVGLFLNNQGTQSGYVLFAPTASNNTYLIDKCGKKVHEWVSAQRPGQSVYLLADGNLFRTGDAENPIYTSGGSGGILEKLDWNSNVLWSYTISDSLQCQHHDACPLPNGNFLAIVWESKTKPQAVSAGRNPATTNANFWSEKVIELQPLGADSAIIVWEWHVWDHLVQEFDSTKINWGIVAEHPELINLNYAGRAASSDWLHINAIAYNQDLDQIVLSNHNFNEIWIIDHSTTTAQAASHSGGTQNKGGDLLYRWGNPQAYNHGTTTDKKLFGQHNAYWIEEGLPDENRIMLYNNGNGRPEGNFSTVEIISPPVDSSGGYSYTPIQAYAPANSILVYQAPVPIDFYSAAISGAQRLPNGNTLICEGTKGNFFEVNPAQSILWRYVCPVNASGVLSQGAPPIGLMAFRCTQYQSDYSAFTGKDLTPGSPVELNPLPDSCNMVISDLTEMNMAGRNITVSPNPASESLQVTVYGLQLADNLFAEFIDNCGRVVLTFPIVNSQWSIDISMLPKGIYFLKISGANISTVRKVVVGN